MDFDRIAKEAFRALDIHHPKDEQLQAVRALVLDKKNVFVQLPTGFGKSACFQVLPLICDLLANKTKYHVVLVITPLIAISQDQVDTLTKLGIDACSWSDTHTDMETTSKGAQIIFTTPEALIGVTGKEKNPKGLSLVSTEKFRPWMKRTAASSGRDFVPSTATSPESQPSWVTPPSWPLPPPAPPSLPSS